MNTKEKNQFLINRFLNKTYSFVLTDRTLFGEHTYHYTVKVAKLSPKVGSDRNFYLGLKFDAVIRESDGADMSDCDIWLNLQCLSNMAFRYKINSTCIREIRRVSKNYLNHELGDISFNHAI